MEYKIIIRGVMTELYCEDNIENFKRKYHKKYYDFLVPVLKCYEKQRKKALFWAIFWTIVLNIAGILYFYFICKYHIEGRHVADPGIYLIGFGVMSYWMAKKSFENKIKSRIMEHVCACFGNFTWCKSYSLYEAQNFVKAGLFRDFTTYEVDDAFFGTYKGVDIDIAEAEFVVGSGKNRSTVFQGLLIKLKMNKNFKGHTLLMEDKLLHKSPLPTLRHTELEDVAFEKRYDVFTDDEVEARYILTPTLMERLAQIKMAFHCKAIRCAFLEGQLYIAMETSLMQDLFSLGSLTRPVADTKQFTRLCRQFVSVLALIDHLKLDKKAVL